MLENFQAHSKSEISFDDFNSAQIIGHTKASDLESNGVGKTTIFKAIEYAIFNRVSAQKFEKIIRDGTDACKVIFIFEADNDIYKIERSRGRKVNSSDVRLYKQLPDKSWKDETQRRISDTEKEIEKLIKISYEAFKNSVLFSQKSESDLASLTPEKRKLLLKETLKIIHYSKLEKIAKKKTADFLKEIEKNKNSLSMIDNPQKDINEYNKKIIEIENTLKDILINYSFQEKDIADITIKQEHAKSQLYSLKKEALLFDANIKSIQLQKTEIELSIKDINNKLSSLTQENIKISNDITIINNNLTELLNIKLSPINEMQDQFNKLSNDLVDNQSTLKSFIIELEKLRIPLPKDSICAHCRLPVSEEHRITCQQDIDKKIIQTEQDMKVIKNNIFEIKTKQAKLLDEINKANKITKNIDDSKYKLSIKEKEIESKKTLYIEYITILNKKNKDFLSKDEELKSIQDKITNSNINEIVKLNNMVNELTQQKAIKDKEAEILTRQINELSTKKAIIEDKITQKKTDLIKITEINKTLSSLEDEYKINQLVVQAFSSGGIPSLIIHNILDDLQIETNNWLSKLKPAIQLKFSIIKDNKTSGEQEDTLEISYTINGTERDYEQISGGQRLAVSLSLRLALLEILKKQLGVDIKMLLLDEVDQPLDDLGLEGFCDIIKSLQKDFKILVITHNKSLKDKFSHAIYLEQDENFITTSKLITAC